jgi:hypothetical protein
MITAAHDFTLNGVTVKACDEIKQGTFGADELLQPLLAAGMIIVTPDEKPKREKPLRADKK